MLGFAKRIVMRARLSFWTKAVIAVAIPFGAFAGGVLAGRALGETAGYEAAVEYCAVETETVSKWCGELFKMCTDGR